MTRPLDAQPSSAAPSPETEDGAGVPSPPPTTTGGAGGEAEPSAEGPASGRAARASASRMARWLAPETRTRRLLIGLALYGVCLFVFALFAGDRLLQHTPYNHYAHLADAWLHGRHHLVDGPPAYAGMNDFALFDAKWFISFPPFPAVLMMPLVWASGSPESFRDGQFIVWLAGVGPAALFLALEKLRRAKRSSRTERENAALSLLFAFGTVYFFTAVQGTVWFAAHVVGVGLMALFVLFALDAERPALSGLMLGLLFLTRTTALLVGVFFVLEAMRASAKRDASGAVFASGDASGFARAAAFVERVDLRLLAKKIVPFAVPVLGAFAFASWLNHARFTDAAPWAFGHEHLQIGWKARIDRWGLFSFHFLPRNLSVVLASLPWRPLPGEAKVPLELLGATFAVPRFVISGHGLALWVTTPMYLWLLRPKATRGFAWTAALVAALGPATMNLLYQNSGWFQFGYRFSNDYAVFLFVMLAAGTARLSRPFWVAAAFAVAINTFGAASFDRPKFSAFYSHQAATRADRYGGPATLDLVFPPD